ncbi:hypothetical protein AB0J72_41315 [Dactylosporangium sp. NPDC049742]|uniref:hypothetical protein n=1 Tax=Dactylosporangium sp. NPDC049742 TaxID=3154737 RepID=UPI003429D288
MQVASRSAYVYELVGDRYADLDMPERSIQWWQEAVRIHVTSARAIATSAGARELESLAGKLAALAANVARRLAVEVRAEAAAGEARLREAIAELDAM